MHRGASCSDPIFIQRVDIVEKFLLETISKSAVERFRFCPGQKRGALQPPATAGNTWVPVVPPCESIYRRKPIQEVFADLIYFPAIALAILAFPLKTGD